jgi:nitroreductase
MGETTEGSRGRAVKLPGIEPGKATLEDIIARRRTVRRFTDSPLALDDVSKLLFAGQGVTGKRGGRTTPSAGALHPLEILLAAGKIEGLEPGVYRYLPDEHSLALVLEGDRRSEIGGACLGQTWIAKAQCTLIVTAFYERTASKYGTKEADKEKPASEELAYEIALAQYGGQAVQFANIEAGCAAQNINLQAVALGLGSGTIGAYFGPELGRVLNVEPGEYPVVVLPVGKPAT